MARRQEDAQEHPAGFRYQHGWYRRRHAPDAYEGGGSRLRVPCDALLPDADLQLFRHRQTPRRGGKEDGGGEERCPGCSASESFRAPFSKASDR